jgi:Outer membrane protein beta-barrel domain
MMKRSGFVLTWSLAVLIPALAAAQTTTTGATTNTQGLGDGWLDRVESHWFGSGFVGSSFGQDAEEASLDFGGGLGYLWNGVVGAEFMANFSPEFELEPARSALILGEQPWINTYMVNAIAAAPLGSEGRFQPYVSGGVGAMNLRADAILDPDTGDASAFEPDDTRGGGNIGFGFMGYGERVGFRADVRYFRGFNSDASDVDPDDTTPDFLGRLILSELEFWRANIGLAFKW